jgi:hypothetical protein
VNAVIAPLAGQVGVWPDVAPDPRQAMALCADAWLAVLELQDEEWRALARDLRALHGLALGIVVALPAGSAAPPLEAADEQVSWDGAPGPVLEAVQRLAAAQDRAAAPTPPAPSTEEHLFEAAEAPAEVMPPAAGAGPGFRSSSIWPGTVLSRSEAESVLVAAVAGLWPQEALRPLAERVVASLSDLEKAALRGDPVTVEPSPVCRAAALRWVVTVALEAAPAPGSPVDGAAVQAILGDIDGALADLKGVGEGAGPEALPALEALRRVLVKEAIDLTDAVHRIVPSEVVAAPAAPAVAPREARKPPPRAVAFGARPARRPGRGKRRLWIALAIATTVGVAFHGYDYVRRRPPPPPPTVPGAPESLIGSIDRATGIATLTSTSERPPSLADVEKFRLQEELKGRAVREMAPGVYISEPAHRVEKAAPAGSQGHP